MSRPARARAQPGKGPRRLRIGGLQVQCLLKRQHRLIGEAAALQDEAEIVARLRIGRLKRYRGDLAIDRLGEPAELLVGRGEVLVRAEIVGLQAARLL